MRASSLIRSVRLGSRQTLRELAARAGTSHATLSAYEQGRVEPAVDTLDRVVRAAGYALDATLERRIRYDPLTQLDRGDELVAVLDLAAQFPARHDDHLTMPRFGA